MICLFLFVVSVCFVCLFVCLFVDLFVDLFDIVSIDCCLYDFVLSVSVDLFDVVLFVVVWSCYVRLFVSC